MKLLKIVGMVAGAHLLLMMLVFVIPGCSSTTKPEAPAVAADSGPAAAPPAPAPAAATPLVATTDTTAPATASAPAADAPVFYSPTRPGTKAAEAIEQPATPVATAEVTPTTSYTVKNGDSLWLIAHKNHISEKALAAANHLGRTATLHSGQKLLIPGKSPAGDAAPASAAMNAPASAPAGAPAPAAGSAVTSATEYTVRSGDKLSTIAHRYGLRTGELALANNITDPAKIRPGQKLIIPAGHAASPAKSGSAARKGKTKSAPAEAAPAANDAAPAASPSLVPVEPAPDQAPAAPSASSATLSPPIIRIDGSAPSSSAAAPTGQ